MALEEYRADMETCCRCSACKFIPLERLVSAEHTSICPSISRYNFHAYSGGGRLGLGVALLENQIGISDKLLEVIYNCQMCGGCDIACKYAMDMEVLAPINEIRADCVRKGRTLPALNRMASSLRDQGCMVPPGSDGGSWTEGLKVSRFSEKANAIAFHAGCRVTANPALWKTARSGIQLMQKAGVEVSLADHELCCGGRAYETGYEEDFLRQANLNMGRLKAAGIKTLITGCAECYYAFNVLYDRAGLKGDLSVVHVAEFLADLITQGKLKPERELKLRITYHDPCHLGRLGEPHIPWEGKRLPGQMILFDPPKEFRRGSRGIYAPPREVLKSLPGIDLVEMDRTREYAWCCGAGGGVRETNPAFARWTAAERLKEAASTGAEAIVTACPGCVENLSAAATGASMKVYDIAELVAAAVL